MKYVKGLMWWQDIDPLHYVVDYDFIVGEFKKQGSAPLRQKCIAVSDSKREASSK